MNLPTNPKFRGYPLDFEDPARQRHFGWQPITGEAVRALKTLFDLWQESRLSAGNYDIVLTVDGSSHFSEISATKWQPEVDAGSNKGLKLDFNPLRIFVGRICREDDLGSPRAFRWVTLGDGDDPMLRKSPP